MCVITGSIDDNANHSRALSSEKGGGQTELEAAGLLGAGPVAGRERQAREINAGCFENPLPAALSVGYLLELSKNS